MAFSTRGVLTALTLLSLTVVPLTAQAQSLTTTYTGGNGNNTGGGVFFDLNVLATGGITINSLDTNVAGGVAGNPVNLEIWIRSGTAFGFEADATGWTLISTGSGVSSLTNIPTFVDITDFSLGSGITGVAIRNVNYGAEYTDGSNVFSNSDLSLTTGSASNNFLAGGPINSPRTWNGTLNYTVAPEPGSLALLALGIAGGAFARRRKIRL